MTRTVLTFFAVAATLLALGACTSVREVYQPPMRLITPSPTATATTVPAATPSPARTAKPSPPPISRGGDVILVGGVVLPNSARTPGERNPAVTQATIGSTICVSGWTATVRPPSSVTTAIKVQQLASGYAFHGDTSTSDYEEDHLISLELGGSPSSVANLWPEPYAAREGARAKDALENRLHVLVCETRVSLLTAQKAIADNWWDAYRKYVVTTPRPVVKPQPVAPAPPTTHIVHPGAFCAVRGATGVTTTGRAMVCKTTSTDSRLRWRSA
ncbi:hypothetical protein [Galbitalea soli]|uniref:Lipoprotein n=1 Tax=Galbitalea soli TaxID=1268042 RepID=A0A7C9PM98_9MICO|nr:hypothetical protein [Galbitalea soli]NEM90810.1 hypothetical protein [Galbitalea soli]NYJ31528.1 hypothetical protein [Galbitalea soli]